MLTLSKTCKHKSHTDKWLYIKLSYHILNKKIKQIYKETILPYLDSKTVVIPEVTM